MPYNKWDERFLSLAEFVASWSKDPSKQVGAVIVDDKKRIVSLGFNGFPAGIADDDRLDDRETKYDIIIHAEINALLFAGRKLEGCTMYVWPIPPCCRCASQIIQSGISRVVAPAVEETDKRWYDSVRHGENLMKEAGIRVILAATGGIRGG